MILSKLWKTRKKIQNGAKRGKISKTGHLPPNGVILVSLLYMNDKSSYNYVYIMDGTWNLEIGLAAGDVAQRCILHRSAAK
jgi:hypothetical protein